MSRVILLLVLLIIITALIISCTEEKIVSSASPTVTVTGKVYGWLCGVGDCINNPGSEHRYSVRTGLPATVKFVREESCCTFSVQTDDSSVYSITPEVGNYFIVIETRHCCPDTVFDITLSRDTAIDFDIVYDYLTHDTVFADYFYADPTDSMGYQMEWNHIRSLDDRIGNMLDLEGSIRTIHESQFSDWILISYHIPTKPEYAPWQIYNNALRYLASSCKPPELSFYCDFYICLSGG